MRIVGLAIFLASLPVFYSLMSGPIANRRIGWFAIGLVPFLIGPLHLDVSIMSWAYWPGYVKGMIVSLLDSLALAILLTTRSSRTSQPLLWAYVAFLIGSAVASFFATTWLASFFFSWQLARAILLFAAVSRVAAHPEGMKQIIGGLAAAGAIEAVYCLTQRAQGVMQTSGTLGHQNLLGMCNHFVLLLSLAAMLSGDRRRLPLIGVVAGSIVVMLTGSRATVGLAGIGIVLLVGLSVLRRPTPFKMRVAGIGVALLAIGTPIAYAAVQHRAQSQMSSSDGERVAFENAARAMWNDHPMGVGGNQYVVKANADGYSERAGVSWSAGSRSANVHNTYLLIGAETGYLGFVTFVILLLAGVGCSLRLAWARPRGPSGEIALGVGVLVAVVAMHCFYEWVFVVWIVQYLFAIALGIAAGINVQRQTLARRGRELERPPAVNQRLAAATG